MSRRLRAVFAFVAVAGGMTLMLDPNPALADGCDLQCERCRIDKVYGVVTCEDCTISCEPN